MKTTLLKVALRQHAVFVPGETVTGTQKQMTETTSVLFANAAKLGFTFSEPLLNALNEVSPAYKLKILDTLKEITGVTKNWTPLVKGWDVPTGESVTDHIMTFMASVFKAKGTLMPCGHIIPANTFPLERYNGCPFCGTPFYFGPLELKSAGSKLTVLELWQEKDMDQFFVDLLTAKTALDVTQVDSLKLLMQEMPLPDVTISMKETQMIVIDALKEQGKADEAGKFFSTPIDIMRYLWYKKTGLLQIVTPKTLIKRSKENYTHLRWQQDQSSKAALAQKLALKLKYTREDCRIVAGWLNNLKMEAAKACELMHPKRGMWVRFIRALRLAEYAQKEGFGYLKALLDTFYNESYEVWQGKTEQFRLRYDAEKTFALLKQRPGLFARSLFANMLWFGARETAAAFAEVIDNVPARLVLTLNMYAPTYFDPQMDRSVKPLGGNAKRIPANRLLSLYNEEQLEGMKTEVESLCILAMKRRFGKMETTHKTMFIDPALYNMPMAIGDRSQTMQDLPVALMGTRFPVKGDKVRLFMQWGTGLPAQHLDMDLSCSISYPDTIDFCSFRKLVTRGCKHSGDIIHIPNRVGTAEYINLDLAELTKAGAQYVSFTCNAYSNGSLSPNMVVGWMNSHYPMQISATTGVAYEPALVQHQVRITQSLRKGLVFGVLDVMRREITWLEMPFAGQVVQQLDNKGVKALLAKLNSKTSIGKLLELKAEAQGLTITEMPVADEVYDRNWAINTAAVTQLLID